MRHNLILCTDACVDRPLPWSADAGCDVGGFFEWVVGAVVDVSRRDSCTDRNVKFYAARSV